MMNEPTQRVIQEYVPGKQVTLAHVVASPHPSIFLKLGMEEGNDAIGILTITPSEGVIIAADVATKAANVEIGFLDRFGGSLLLTGDVSSVESSLRAVLEYCDEQLHYACVDMTRS
ncbi:BMC domain-containing protein [Desulfobaculum bizertense]|nr:BMC domain-containing protein [Desulfobaculum bizertense]